MAGMRRSESFPHQNQLESMFGEDFSGVEVVTGQRTQLDALGANALAMDEKVAIADQTPTLDLMAHELTHVVQQRNAGSAASGLDATSVFGDPSEREARGAESRALSGQGIEVGAQPTGVLAGDWSIGGVDLSVGGVIGAAIGSGAGPMGALAGGYVGNWIQEAITGTDEEEAAVEAEAAPSQTEAPAATPTTAPVQPAAEERAPTRTPEQRERDRVVARQRREAEQHLQDQGVTGRALEQRMAGFDVRANHVAHGQYSDDDQEVVSLDSEEDRIAALNGFTQNHMASQVDDDEWQYMCGSTTLLGSVMFGSGNEGVGDLATSLSQHEGMDDSQREYLAEIAERARNNQLTRMDLMELNLEMHQEMRQFEREHHNDEQRGVTGAAMQDLGARNPVIDRSMRAADIGLGQVDIEGDGVNNHWVMHQGQHVGSRERLYDPMAVHDGPQMTHDVATLGRYRRADASR